MQNGPSLVSVCSSTLTEVPKLSVELLRFTANWSMSVCVCVCVCVCVRARVHS